MVAQKNNETELKTCMLQSISESYILKEVNLCLYSLIKMMHIIMMLLMLDSSLMWLSVFN